MTDSASIRYSGSVRIASSAENSTSSHSSRARRTALAPTSSTCSRLMLSLCRRWIGLVARKMWMRERPAFSVARATASISPDWARARPQIVGPRTSLATARTDSKSPSDACGNPASITSTPRSASACAMRSFCARVIENPGACSPSRSVVSKTRMRSGSLVVTWGSLVLFMILYRGLCASAGNCSCISPGRSPSASEAKDGRERPAYRPSMAIKNPASVSGCGVFGIFA